jgi:hypothetical protein
MTDNAPTLEDWRRLYAAAARIKETAPWEWMTEKDIFGVQNRETDELGFVSVMGMMGEHYAVSLYLGPDGLYGFWDFEESGPFASPEGLLQIPQLQASFEDRDQLREKDRKIIKDLGLKFRGRHAWPMFRSYRPGFAPWFLEAEEARFLAHALEQTPDVALRFREDPSLLETTADRGYLVRVPRQGSGALAWEDRRVTVPPPEPAPILIGMDLQLIEQLKRLPPSRLRLEMDFFMFPTLITGEGPRPYYPYMLMAVEAQSGMVLGSEMMKPDPSLEAMWGLIPFTVASLFDSMDVVPGEVAVRSELLWQLLGRLAQELGFKLRQSFTLPALDAAKDFLLDRFV